MKTLMSALPLSAAGAAIATISLAMPSSALTVLSNPLFNNGANNAISTSTISATQQKAVSFTTDSRAWSLDSISVTLTGFDDADGSNVLQIRADDGSGSPSSTVLATLGNPSPAPTELGATSDFTFTPTSAFTFAPSTSYWLVIARQTGDFNWAVLTNRSTPTSTQGWTYGAYKFTTNSGTSWTNSGIFNPVSIDATEIAPVPFAFTPIPGLIVSGIIGAARRARKSRNSEGVAEA